MTAAVAASLAFLLLPACASRQGQVKTESTAVSRSNAPAIRTIEFDSRSYQVEWIDYEMDFYALIRGAREMLSVEQDPWSRVATPPDTVSTVVGFVRRWQDGQMDLTGEIVSWENRDLQFDGGSPHLSHRAPHEIPTWRLPSDSPFRLYKTLAGSRIGTDVNSRNQASPTNEEATPPVADFEDGERYVFCVKHDPAGELPAWAGDILAVIHLVPTYKIAAPNPIWPIDVARLKGFKTVETGKAANAVAFELSKVGREFGWRDNRQERNGEASSQFMQMLTYALNGIIWEKLPVTPEKDGPAMPWQYVIQYEDRGSTRSVTLSPLANGKELILESAELGRWKGEDAGLITAAFGKL